MKPWTAAVLLALVAAAPRALADPLTSTSPDAVLPDPVPDNGASFPPAIVTAGAADPGAALDRAVAGGRKGCSPVNPCAMATPTLNGMPHARHRVHTAESAPVR